MTKSEKIQYAIDTLDIFIDKPGKKVTEYDWRAALTASIYLQDVQGVKFPHIRAKRKKK